MTRLSGAAPLLIASVEALQDHLPPPDWFKQAVFTLKPGDETEPQALAVRLAEMGYERVDLVEGRGQFALRGDILDCFPPSLDVPVRAEFFDVQVDSIRAFDILTQRSLEPVDRLRVIPAAEHWVPKAEREAAAARLQKALDAMPDARRVSAWELAPLGQPGQPFLPPDPEALRGQGHIPNMAMWAHAVYPPASLLDWMADPIVLIDTPDRAMQRLDDNLTGFAEAFKTALAQGNAGLAQAGLLRQRDEVTELLEHRTLITLMSLLRGLGGFRPETAIALRGTAVPPYHSRPQALVEDLKAWEQEGYTVALCAGGQARVERLTDMLRKNGLSPAEDGAPSGIRILASPLSAGFVFEGARLALVAPAELFGASQQKARKRQTAGERSALQIISRRLCGARASRHRRLSGTVRLQSEEFGAIIC